MKELHKIITISEEEVHHDDVICICDSNRCDDNDNNNHNSDKNNTAAQTSSVSSVLPKSASQHLVQRVKRDGGRFLERIAVVEVQKHDDNDDEKVRNQS